MWISTHTGGLVRYDGYTNSLKGKSIKTVNVFVLLRSFFMIYHT